ncbi:hypothetical protein PR202_ga24205 [Eleusine coracana subsp. coracana]|uniref:Uncharacterized protein n=1 Tax=Eleusine coracana subsp. coracana TaxID=191504 RepID=A0AAV5D7X7_ELECO|nr:hypothetical protein PR202_ga24205 [Eleusine coracana subsp. coracana]
MRAAHRRRRPPSPAPRHQLLPANSRLPPPRSGATPRPPAAGERSSGRPWTSRPGSCATSARPPCCMARRSGRWTTGNRLFFVYFGLVAGDNILIAKISYFDIRGDDIKTGRKEWSTFEEGIFMPQMKMTGLDSTFKLRWIGEKSGVVIFTMMGGGGRHTDTFALNMRDGTVEMLAEADGEGHAWGNVLGFEMDWTADLASVIHSPTRGETSSGECKS